jgi:hypothetical protein
MHFQLPVLTYQTATVSKPLFILVVSVHSMFVEGAKHLKQLTPKHYYGYKIYIKCSHVKIHALAVLTVFLTH